MKFILIFTFFVSIKCFSRLSDTRQQRPLLAKDVIKLVESSKEFSDFHAIVNRNYENFNFEVSPGSLKSIANDTFTAVTRLNDIFIQSVYEFIKNVLINYCESAIKIIRPAHNNDSIIRSIKFDKDFKFCVLAFLYDSGLDVDVMFEIMNFFYFLSRISENDFNPDKCKSQLEVFLQRLSATNVEKNVDAKIIKMDTFKQSLIEMKNKLKDFSSIFCPLTVTLIISGSIFESPDKDSFNTGSFYDFNEKETFTVNFSLNTEDRMPTQKWHLLKWDCGRILKSPEYKYEVYAENVMKQEGMFDRFCKCMTWGKELVLRIMQFENPNAITNDETTEISKTSDLSSGTFTLYTLRDYLDSNNYYLNLVQYYNISLEVMVYSTIKEGLKIFKGIKHEMSDDGCSSGFLHNIRKIYKMRRTLLLFKIIFEKLFLEVQKKSHIDVSQNATKQNFINRVNNLLGLLNISKDQSEHNTEEVCSKIKEELSSVTESHIGVNHNELKFCNYYFFGPIFTIFRLYQGVQSK